MFCQETIGRLVLDMGENVLSHSFPIKSLLFPRDGIQLLEQFAAQHHDRLVFGQRIHCPGHVILMQRAKRLIMAEQGIISRNSTERSRFRPRFVIRFCPLCWP